MLLPKTRKKKNELAPAVTVAAGTNEDGAKTRCDERDEYHKLCCPHELILTQKEGTRAIT